MFGSDDFLPDNYGAEPMQPITEPPRPRTLADFAALSNHAMIPVASPAANPVPQILGNVGVATVINPHLPPAMPNPAPMPPPRPAPLPPPPRANGRLRATHEQVPYGSPFGLPYTDETPTKVISFMRTEQRPKYNPVVHTDANGDVDLLGDADDDAVVVDWGDDEFTFQCAMGLIEGPYDEIDQASDLGDASDEEVREGPLKKLKARRDKKKIEKHLIDAQLRLLKLGWRFDEMRRQWYIDVARPGYLYRVWQDEAVAILEGKLPSVVKAHGQVLAPETSQAVAIRRDVADNILPGFTTMVTAGEKPRIFPPPMAKSVMKEIARLDKDETEEIEAEESPQRKERRKRRSRPKRRRGGRKTKRAKAKKAAPAPEVTAAREERREKLSQAALQVAQRFLPSGSDIPPTDDFPPPDDGGGDEGGAAQSAESSGLPSWAWALIALGGVIAVSGTAYVILRKKKGEEPPPPAEQE